MFYDQDPKFNGSHPVSKVQGDVTMEGNKICIEDGGNQM